MAKQPNQYTKGGAAGSGQNSRSTTSRSQQTSFGEDLSSHNLDWLQDRARELEIEGRSDMNKDQLIRAIQQHK